jgi:hypothetical protein
MRNIFFFSNFILNYFFLIGGDDNVGSEVLRGIVKTFEYLLTPHHSDQVIAITIMILEFIEIYSQ